MEEPEKFGRQNDQGLIVASGLMFGVIEDGRHGWSPSCWRLVKARSLPKVDFFG